MKYIRNPELTTDLAYPVGENVTENKEKILEMIKSFSKIREFKKKFVNIICMGSSGTIIATLFAMHLRNANKIIHVKKSGEWAHHKILCFNTSRNSINIIVDDFISSGDTMRRIYEETQRRGERDIHCVCVTGVYAQGQIDSLGFTPKYFICGGDTPAHKILDSITDVTKSFISDFKSLGEKVQATINPAAKYELGACPENPDGE